MIPGEKIANETQAYEYMKDHIFEIYSYALCTFYEYITNSQCDQLPDGLIAQLVEHVTGIAEVMGSNPVQA